MSSPAPSGQVYGLGSSSLQFLNMFGVSADMSCLDPVAQNYMKAGEIECAYASGTATAPPPGFNKNGTRSVPLTTTTPITLYSNGAEIINGTSYLFMEMTQYGADQGPYISSDNKTIDGETKLKGSDVFFLTKFNCDYRRMGVSSPGSTLGMGTRFFDTVTASQQMSLPKNTPPFYPDKGNEDTPTYHPNLTQKLYYGDFVQIMVYKDSDVDLGTEVIFGPGGPPDLADMGTGTGQNVTFYNPGGVLGQNPTVPYPGDCTVGSFQTFQILAILTDPLTNRQYSSLSPEDTVYDGKVARAGGNPENAPVMLGDNLLLVAVSNTGAESQGLAISFAYNGAGQSMSQSGGLFSNDGYQQIGKTGDIKKGEKVTLIQNSKQKFLADGFPAPLAKENFTNGPQIPASVEDMQEAFTNLQRENFGNRENFGKRENFGMSGGLQWWGVLLIVIGILVVLAVGYFVYDYYTGAAAIGTIGNLVASVKSNMTKKAGFGRFKY